MKKRVAAADLYDSLIGSFDAIMLGNRVNTVCVQPVQIKCFCIFVHFLKNHTSQVKNNRNVAELLHCYLWVSRNWLTFEHYCSLGFYSIFCAKNRTSLYINFFCMGRNC